MAKLKTVISSVLRDVLLAQHEADLLAQQLADKYGDLRALAPTVEIGDVQLTLHYAITDLTESTADPQDMDVEILTDELNALQSHAVQSMTITVSAQHHTQSEAST